MNQSVTLAAVLKLVEALSPSDKLKLVEQMMPTIDTRENDVLEAPRKSLRGVWHGIDITEADIAAARQEMWGNFPRKDI